MSADSSAPSPSTSPGALLPGAEPFSATGPDGAPGVLVLHGFTGSPSSMRGIATAFAAAGYHVELPLLVGHGTTVDDMVPTRWADWVASVEAAWGRLAARAERIAVAGLSLGGSLALHTALAHPDAAALVLVNPATQQQAADVVAMLDEMLAGGMAVMPAIGSDIAMPDVVEVAYDGTPVAPLLSANNDGWAMIESRYGELTMPLLLFTSRQDHVVDPAQSEHLAATYGGPVDHRWLERSYHVATQDFDAADIETAAVEFVGRVVAPGAAADDEPRRS